MIKIGYAERRIMIKSVESIVSSLAAIAFTCVVVAGTGEAVLRWHPEIKPYANTWNYVRSYEQLSRLFRGAPPHGDNDIVMVAYGDSFTRGAEVAPGETWIDRLNATHNDAIFNWGVGGSSTVEQFALMSGQTFEPSVRFVLLAVFHNDIEDNPADLVRLETQGAGPFFRRAQKASSIGAYDTCRDDGWILRAKCWYFRSHFISTLYDVYRQLTQDESFQPTIDTSASGLVFDDASQRYVSADLDLSDFADIDAWLDRNAEAFATTVYMIERIQDFLDQNDIQLLVVFLPSFGDVYVEDWAARSNMRLASDASVGTLLGGTLADKGIPYLDLTPHLRRVRHSEAPLFLPLDPHPTPAGHRIIADHIERFFADHGVDLTAAETE